MAVEDSVAQDQLKSFVRRVEALDDEIAALNRDKSEIFKESKSAGFDNKIVRKVIAKRRLGEVERDEQDALFDLYWDAIHAPEKKVVHARVEIIEEFDAETGEITPSQPTKAAGQAEPLTSRLVATSSVENEAAEISTPIPEQQSPQPAASDLTSPSLGQVATYTPETANDNPRDETDGGSHESAAHRSVEPLGRRHDEDDAQDDALTAGGGHHEVETTSAQIAVEEGATIASAAPISFADRIKKLRPNCQQPDSCRSSGGREHCWTCKKAMAETGSAA